MIWADKCAFLSGTMSFRRRQLVACLAWLDHVIGRRMGQ